MKVDGEGGEGGLEMGMVRRRVGDGDGDGW